MLGGREPTRADRGRVLPFPLLLCFIGVLSRALLTTILVLSRAVRPSREFASTAACVYGFNLTSALWLPSLRARRLFRRDLYLCDARGYEENFTAIEPTPCEVRAVEVRELGLSVAFTLQWPDELSFFPRRGERDASSRAC